MDKGRKAWESQAATKRAKLQASIPANWRLANLSQLIPADVKNVTKIPQRHLTDDEFLITESSAAVLLENIHTGVWSAVEVTRAFCHRAAIAHQLVNCLTEILFDDAVLQANELDAFRARTGHLKGPLHGLPVSFMDRYRIANAETACGYVARLGKYETPSTESLLVKQMRELGAIPFCKTNVPMSMMIGETDNNIIGATLNPYARHLSAGGAAGGEGALLAMGGSSVGWGTEIAGSVRVPAAFANVYGLKPSSNRFPAQGVAGSSPSTPICDSTPALFCRDIASLKMVSKAVLTKLPVGQDSSLLDLPWRENKYAACAVNRFVSHKPKFAVLYCDGHVRPHPPVLRALDVTNSALKAAGYTVVDWSPPAHEPAVRTLFQILGADGLSGVRSMIAQSGEPPVAQLQEWYYQSGAASMNVPEFWSLCEKRVKYQQSYQEYWNTTDVDGVIMPTSPSACAKSNQMTYFGYTAITNLLDYSAGAFPVGFADRHIGVVRPPRSHLSLEDAKTAATCELLMRRFHAFTADQCADDPDTFHGAPVGLQVMCRRLEEEKVIALMEVIKAALE